MKTEPDHDGRFVVWHIKGAWRVVGSSHIFYITRYITWGRKWSDRLFSLHHASMPEQIKVAFSICKHILCDVWSAPCSCIDNEVTMVYQMVSYLSCIPGNKEHKGWPKYASGTFVAHIMSTKKQKNKKNPRAPHAGANARLSLHLENSESKKGHNFVKKNWKITSPTGTVVWPIPTHSLVLKYFDFISGVEQRFGEIYVWAFFLTLSGWSHIQ